MILPVRSQHSSPWMRSTGMADLAQLPRYGDFFGLGDEREYRDVEIVERGQGAGIGGIVSASSSVFESAVSYSDCGFMA